MPQLQLKLHCGEEVKQLESGRPVQLAFTVKEMSNELRSAVAQLTFFFFSFIQSLAHVIVCVLPSFGVNLSTSVSEIKIIPTGIITALLLF